jgi:hypothetical protein
VVEERFWADRESLGRWAEQWRGRVDPVAIEAATGWRWVWRELVSPRPRYAAARARPGAGPAGPPAECDCFEATLKEWIQVHDLQTGV